VKAAFGPQLFLKWEYCYLKSNELFPRFPVANWLYKPFKAIFAASIVGQVKQFFSHGSPFVFGLIVLES
jgi:hypothetical protein